MYKKNMSKNIKSGYTASLQQDPLAPVSDLSLLRYEWHVSEWHTERKTHLCDLHEEERTDYKVQWGQTTFKDQKEKKHTNIDQLKRSTEWENSTLYPLKSLMEAGEFPCKNFSQDIQVSNKNKYIINLLGK